LSARAAPQTAAAVVEAADDPANIDKMFAHELNQLSLHDRERVMDEVHGVTASLTSDDDVKEDDALVAMQKELDYHYFAENYDCGDAKRKPTLVPYSLQQNNDSNTIQKIDHYYTCTKPPPSSASSPPVSTSTSTNTNTSTTSAYKEARLKNSNLVKDINFRRAFLIAEDNDPKRAALRLMKYMDLLRNVFDTSDVQFRPILLSDLHPKAREQLLMGPYQILPDRDSSGRKVFCYLRSISPEAASMKLRQQIYLYFYQFIMEDTAGMVAVVFLHHSSAIQNRVEDVESYMNLIASVPSRFKAIHLCLPDRRFYNILRSVIMVVVGKANRPRIRLHIGSVTECKYRLSPFGIPVARLPASLEFNTTHRKDNVAMHTKWVRLQAAKEIILRQISSDKNRSSSSPEDLLLGLGQQQLQDYYRTCRETETETTERMAGAIGMEAVYIFRSLFLECPHHEDCLFGRGRNSMKHPGNVAMRRLLQQKLNRYGVAEHHTKAQIAREVLKAIKNGGGRFLKESSVGLYTRVEDEAARKKISIAFRDLKSKSRQKSAAQQTQTTRHEGNQATIKANDITARASENSTQEVAKRQKFSHTEAGADDPVPGDRCIPGDQCCKKWF